MTERSDFQHLTKFGKKYFAQSLVVQAAPCRDQGQERGSKLGITASRKVGNAVMRNRAKRRLRAASDAVMSGQVRLDWDYVLVARTETISRPWLDLVADLRLALGKLRALPEGSHHDQQQNLQNGRQNGFMAD